MMETKNATITGAYLSIADRGILEGWISLDYGNSSQGFGGYALYVPRQPERKSTAGHFIFRVMQVAGVKAWHELPGKTIRVQADSTKVHRIGHILNEDWFDPAVDFAAFN